MSEEQRDDKKGDDVLMEIAHIVMGFENEDPATHYQMLSEIRDVIASAPQSAEVARSGYTAVSMSGCVVIHGPDGHAVDWDVVLWMLNSEPRSARALSIPAIAGAVARGWCSPNNEHKVMDPELAFAITAQIAALLNATDSGMPPDNG